MAKPAVLVADQYQLIQDLFVQILVEEFDVTATSDGALVLDLLNEGQYDVLVIDLDFRLVDSFNSIKRIQMRHPSLPIIVTSVRLEDHLSRLDEIGIPKALRIAKPFRQSTAYVLGLFKGSTERSSVPGKYRSGSSTWRLSRSY